MPRHHHRILTALAALTLAGTSIGVATPSQANSWPQAKFVAPTQSPSNSTGCSLGTAVNNSPADISLTPGAATSTMVASGSVTATNNDLPSDTNTVSASLTGRARLLGTTAAPTGVRFDYKGTGTVAPSGSTSFCSPGFQRVTAVTAQFTVTANTHVSAYAETHGVGLTEVIIGQEGGNQLTQLAVGNTPASQRSSFFLRPGNYEVLIYGIVTVSGTKHSSPTGWGQATVDFAPAGSRTSSMGKSPYLTLPSSRDCAAHNLTATVTGKKSLAKSIQKVDFIVNGKRLRTVKHPHKGAKLTLGLGAYDGQSLRVGAQATVRKKGRTKVVTTVSLYYQCALF